MSRTVLIAAVSLAFSTLAAAGPTMEKDGVLRDTNGNTLYLFAKDEAGKSNCNDACILKWPAFTAKADAQANADLTIVVRNDGSRQWALKGKPLYYFAGDAKAGDTHGEGIGGVWSVVRSGAAVSKTTPSTY